MEERKYYLEEVMPEDCFRLDVAKALILARVGEWKYVAKINMPPIELMNAVVYFASVSGMHIQVAEDYMSFRKTEPFGHEFDFLLRKDFEFTK